MEGEYGRKYRGEKQTDIEAEIKSQVGGGRQ